ncbi:hypothetical protein Tco_0289303 [Tanacetum coccineum]
MASDGSDPDEEYALSKLLQMSTVAEYQNEFEMLIKRVTTPNSLLKSPGSRSTLHVPTTLGTVEVLSSNLGEAFFRARITEARFEDENNQAVATNVGDQEDPDVKDKQEVKKADDLIENIKDEEGKNVKDAFETPPVTVTVIEDVRIEFVDEDELNIVISVLKDGDDEFDDRLNKINLNLSHEFVIRVLKNRDVFGESLVVLLNPIWVPILWGVSGVNKSSFANKDVAMGKEAKRIWDPGIKSVFQDNTLRARWF